MKEDGGSKGIYQVQQKLLCLKTSWDADKTEAPLRASKRRTGANLVLSREPRKVEYQIVPTTRGSKQRQMPTGCRDPLGFSCRRRGTAAPTTAGRKPGAGHDLEGHEGGRASPPVGPRQVGWGRGVVVEPPEGRVGRGLSEVVVGRAVVPHGFLRIALKLVEGAHFEAVARGQGSLRVLHQGLLPPLHPPRL